MEGLVDSQKYILDLKSCNSLLCNLIKWFSDLTKKRKSQYFSELVIQLAQRINETEKPKEILKNIIIIIIFWICLNGYMIDRQNFKCIKIDFWTLDTFMS